MGTDNQRSVHFTNNSRISFGIFHNPATGSCASNDSKGYLQSTNNAGGNRQAFSERRNSVNQTMSRSVCFAPILSGKEDGRSSTCNKPTPFEQVYCTKAFQDGKLTERNTFDKGRRLYGHNRHEGRLFCNTDSYSSSQVSSIYLEKPSVPICCSSFRTVKCAPSFYKGSKTSYCKYERKRDKVSHLHRRPDNSSFLSKGMQRTSKVCSSIPFGSRIHCKYGKVSFSSENSSGVSRLYFGLKKDGSLSSTKEKSDNFNKNRRITRQYSTDYSSSIEYGRTDAISQVGNNARSDLLSFSSERLELCSSRVKQRLQSRYDNKYRCSTGASNVAQKFTELERLRNDNTTTNSGHTNRCLHKRMGSGMPEHRQKDQWPLVKRGEKTTYKLPGAHDSLVCNSNVSKDFSQRTCAPADGQCLSGSIHKQAGRHSIPPVKSNSQEYLGVGNLPSDSDIGRASTGHSERNSRQPVAKFERQSRMVSKSKSLPQTSSEVKTKPSGRSLRLQTECPDSQICVLETRSPGVEGRRFFNSMDQDNGIRLSTVLLNKQTSTKGAFRQSRENAANRTNLEDTALVPNHPEHADLQTSVTAKSTQSSSTPSFQRGVSSSSHAASRMACVSEHLENQGIPNEAAQLILASWRTGTEQQYSGAWRQWTSWCNKRKINPLSATIGRISQFLTVLYKKGLSYSTINTYRSAISMTHLPIDGIAVGNNYLIKRLMKGIFNKRPPVPRYVVTWPVEKVLRYLKIMPDYDRISLKLLTMKTAILVALVSADRGDAIAALTTEFMTIDSVGYHFLVSKPTKSTRPGRGIKQIDLPRFVSDRRICVVRCLNKYLKATKDIRMDKQLFISYVKPHRCVTRATIARWIKAIMQKAGIDVSIFKPHSTRSASTSAAFEVGVSVPDILQKADWTNATVFHRFYNRPRVHKDFSQAILSMK